MNYYIIENGLQIGPLTIEQLKFKNISPNTQVWCEGMPEWKKANEVDELKELFVTNTPPPPPFPSQSSFTKPQPTEPCPDNHLTMAIIATVITFFCCSGLPIGIISLIYSLEVERKWEKGLYDKALNDSKNARSWAIASFFLAGIGFVICFIYIFLIIGLEAM